MRLSFLIVTMLIVASTGMAKTYFIDYASGSDSNSGTSKENAWKKCPGMATFSGSYTHNPGDSFVFKGGITWPSAALPFTIEFSGSSEKADVYTTNRSWFAGSAWSQPTFDGELFGKTILSATNISYIKINDLHFINAGSLKANGFIGFKFINCSYLEISNNTFAPEAWGCLYISAEKTGNYYDILVHHNDLSRCAYAVRIVPAAPAAIMHNVQIYNNNIHDFHSQLSGSVHGDGIQHYCSPDDAASYDRYIDGFKIFNNRFTGDFTQVSGSSGAMTALVYLSGSSKGVEIYNNLFAPFTTGTQSPNFFESFISLRDNPNRGGSHKIYNNTFVTRVSDGQAAALLEDDLRYPSPNLDVRNNIFSGFDWPFDLRSQNHVFDFNNLYFTRNIGKWAGSWVESFSDWQKIGNDINGISLNPQFVSTTDFHLSQASPCVDRGVLLAKSYATDLEGTSRPQGTTFDIGAFEITKTTTAVGGKESHSGGSSKQSRINGSTSIGNTRNYDLLGKQIQLGNRKVNSNPRITVVVPDGHRATIAPINK